MGTTFGKSRPHRHTLAHIDECEQQSDHATGHGAGIIAQLHADDSTGDGCGQRQNIAQIRTLPDTAGSDGDRDMIADFGTDIVGDRIAPRTTAKHLRQALTTTAALLVATPATTLLYLDQGNIPHLQFADDGTDR